MELHEVEMKSSDQAVAFPETGRFEACTPKLLPADICTHIQYILYCTVHTLMNNVYSTTRK